MIRIAQAVCNIKNFVGKLINTEVTSITNNLFLRAGMASAKDGRSSSSAESNQLIFNPKAWLSEFRSSKNDTKRRLRVEIMQQTLEACENFKYTLKDGSQVTFADHESVSRDARKTTLHFEEPPPRRTTEGGDKDFKTKIVVVNADCLEEAIRLKNERLNPAVLNMASSRRPGKCDYMADYEQSNYMADTSVFL